MTNKLEELKKKIEEAKAACDSTCDSILKELKKKREEADAAYAAKVNAYNNVLLVLHLLLLMMLVMLLILTN